MLRCSIHPLMFSCRVVNFNTFSHTFLPVGLSPLRVSVRLSCSSLMSVCPYATCLHYCFLFSCVFNFLNTSLGLWQSIHLCHPCLFSPLHFFFSSQQFNLLYWHKFQRSSNEKTQRQELNKIMLINSHKHQAEIMDVHNVKLIF